MITNDRRIGWRFFCFIVFVLSLGCGQKAFEEFSSPERTLKTYLDVSGRLRTYIDPTVYRDTIACFSSSAQKYFEQNFEALKPSSIDEDQWQILNKMRKKAWVFGDVVVESGPLGGSVNVVSVSDDEATVEVEGYEGSIDLVKEGPNWKIRDFFGVNAGP